MSDIWPMLVVIGVWILGIFVITLILSESTSREYWYPILVWPVVVALVLLSTPFTIPYFGARKIREMTLR